MLTKSESRTVLSMVIMVIRMTTMMMMLMKFGVKVDDLIVERRDGT